MSIIPIDFNLDVHKDIIMKLCVRNTFNVDDIYLEIYKDLSPKWCVFLNTEEKKKDFRNFIKSKFNGLTSYGYFIIEKKDTGKNSVLGFIIYNIEIDNIVINNREIEVKRSDLLFILIDKKYQRKTLGGKLMKKYIGDLLDKKISIAGVKIESRELKEFYKKYHFTEKKNIVICEEGEYEKLYFIPGMYS
jgi:ribosomal protein S18 acetylase RimI-like enzyme